MLGFHETGQGRPLLLMHGGGEDAGMLAPQEEHVAQVLAYVYQLRAAMAGRVAMPGALPALDVPAELDPQAVPRP